MWNGPERPEDNAPITGFGRLPSGPNGLSGPFRACGTNPSGASFLFERGSRNVQPQGTDNEEPQVPGKEQEAELPEDLEEDDDEDLEDAELDEDQIEEEEAALASDEDDDEDEDEATSLDELLAQRAAARRGSDDADDDDDIMALSSEAVEVDTTVAEPIPVKVAPVKEQKEFVCRSCFLVKSKSQLADAERVLCRDCV